MYLRDTRLERREAFRRDLKDQLMGSEWMITPAALTLRNDQRVASRQRSNVKERVSVYNITKNEKQLVVTHESSVSISLKLGSSPARSEIREAEVRMLQTLDDLAEKTACQMS